MRHVTTGEAFTDVGGAQRLAGCIDGGLRDAVDRDVACVLDTPRPLHHPEPEHQDRQHREEDDESRSSVGERKQPDYHADCCGEERPEVSRAS